MVTFTIKKKKHLEMFLEIIFYYYDYLLAHYLISLR